MTSFLALVLALEIVLTTSWFAGRLPMLAGYGATTLATIGLRLSVTALQAAAAYALTTRNPGAARLAGMAFVLGAVTLTLELGLHLAPSNLFPSHRWPVVGAYWVYALLCTWAAARLHRA